jgi:hypothetical protein
MTPADLHSLNAAYVALAVLVEVLASALPKHTRSSASSGLAAKQPFTFGD